ncbi:MAG: hypothetical protein Q6363_010190 [Candidatus Njordarchaeota archaeon]
MPHRVVVVIGRSDLEKIDYDMYDNNISLTMRFINLSISQSEGKYPRLIMLKVDGKNVVKFEKKRYNSIEIRISSVPLSIINSLHFRVVRSPYTFNIATSEPIKVKIRSQKRRGAKDRLPSLQIFITT